MKKSILFITITLLFIVSCDNMDRDDLLNGISFDNDEIQDNNIVPDNDETEDILMQPDNNEQPDNSYTQPDNGNTIPDDNNTVVQVYYVDSARCNGCRRCIGSCDFGALTMVGGKAFIDPEKCTGCGDCVKYCPRGAIKKK